MPEKSKRVCLDHEKLTDVNPENLRLSRNYIADMTLRELSPKTIYQYQKDLETWFIYLHDNQGNPSVIGLTEDDITDFLLFCKLEGNNAERMKRRIAVISSFYKYLRKKRLIVENPVEFIDRPKKGLPIVVQTFLTTDQVAIMREKLIEYGNLQLRVYALFSLSTMARVNAVANVRWKQIDYDNRVVTDVIEKESKVVDLYFSEEVKRLLLALQQYRKDKGIDDHGWVFHTGRTSDTKPISTTTLNDWCKVIGSMIGVPTLHPHDFRHTGASLLSNAGMSLEDVSDLLHHESTDVTRKHYVKRDKRRISQLKDQFQI